MTPSDKIRAAIAHDRELSNAASPAPWATKNLRVLQASLPDFCFTVADCDYTDVIDNQQKANNAAFIYHARTALPRHADALEEALAALESISNCGALMDGQQAADFASERAVNALAAIAAKLEGKP